MNWKDEGYLLHKTNFDENSIIIEVFTQNHGKYSGVVYGGSSRKLKKIFQIGNKILVNLVSKSNNRMGYFNVELLNPISPLFFDDKKRSIAVLSASTILKILLPERQINIKVYDSFNQMINQLNSKNWIKLYILWELSLIKELGFEINFDNHSVNPKNNNYIIEINDNFYEFPKLFLNPYQINLSNIEIRMGLEFTKKLLIQNFILPNKLKFPLPRNILEKYYS